MGRCISGSQLGPAGKQPGSPVAHTRSLQSPWPPLPSRPPPGSPCPPAAPASSAASRSRSIQAQPAPPGTCQSLFHGASSPCSLKLTRPPARGQGSGRLQGTDLGTSEESRVLTKSSGLSPAPRKLQPRTDPGWALLPGWLAAGGRGLPGARPAPPPRAQPCRAR